ncbi:MAG: protein-L-isoaspartate O-methyltransferase family protein [Candidatus Zipacnadales bacterium]
MATDGDTPKDNLPSESVVELESRRTEREREYEKRRAARIARRRSERQFMGVALICAVLFFAVGFVIARSVWGRSRQNPPATPEVNAPAAGDPVTAMAPTDPITTTELPNRRPSPSSAQADRETPAYHIETREPIPLTSKEAFAAHMKAWRHEEDKWINARWERYQECVRLGDLTHDRVKQAFLATPRHKFCRQWNLSRAYASAFLDIGYGVTISGPHIVCRMTNALNPQPHHKCLEIGTGSGYQAAILANLSNYVYSIEIIKGLAQETMDLYKVLIGEGYEEYKNVHLKAADGYYGWEEYAPFDRIIVTCGIDHHPPDLVKQLAPNGIMVIPIGSPGSQRVLKVTKIVREDGQVDLIEEDLYPGRTTGGTTFVPFTAEGEGKTHFLQ